jgi:hypothetical protein
MNRGDWLIDRGDAPGSSEHKEQHADEWQGSGHAEFLTECWTVPCIVLSDVGYIGIGMACRYPDQPLFNPSLCEQNDCA